MFEWTPRRDAYLIDMFDDGELTLAEIARELGCSWHSVRNRLGRLRARGEVGRKRPPMVGVAKGER